MNGAYASHQDGLKRRWEEKGSMYCSRTPLYTRFLGGNGGVGASPMPAPSVPASSPRKLLGFSALEDDLASTVIPPVTVVLEGRSICHRISLHKHASYESLALALRRIFVDTDDGVGGTGGDVGTTNLDLSNAVPGYIVAYEDMEDDLLLAGDLNWKDFVRVAKRIRIIPVKANRKNTSRRGTNAVKVSLLPF